MKEKVFVCQLNAHRAHQIKGDNGCIMAYCGDCWPHGTVVAINILKCYRKHSQIGCKRQVTLQWSDRKAQVLLYVMFHSVSFLINYYGQQTVGAN